jgi:hypothetical protein
MSGDNETRVTIAARHKKFGLLGFKGFLTSWYLLRVAELTADIELLVLMISS